MLLSFSATKFSSDSDSETLTTYLKAKLHCDVICQKMDTAQNRYSPFKRTAECDKVGEIYEPQLWPDGLFVCCFYEVFKPRKNAGPVDVETPNDARNVYLRCGMNILL